MDAWNHTVGAKQANGFVWHTADLDIALSLLVIAVDVDVGVWDTVGEPAGPRTVASLNTCVCDVCVCQCHGVHII